MYWAQTVVDCVLAPDVAQAPLLRAAVLLHEPIAFCTGMDRSQDDSITQIPIGGEWPRGFGLINATLSRLLPISQSLYS